MAPLGVGIAPRGQGTHGPRWVCVVATTVYGNDEGSSTASGEDEGGRDEPGVWAHTCRLHWEGGVGTTGARESCQVFVLALHATDPDLPGGNREGICVHRSLRLRGGQAHDRREVGGPVHAERHVAGAGC